MRGKKREALIADVVKAWNEVDQRAKPDLMCAHPDLYFAVAWLAARETVAKELRR